MKTTVMHIYGTNNSSIKYVFDVIKEDSDFYYVKDISTTWYELANNIFKVSKNPLRIVSSENPNFNFIFSDNEQFFISFDEVDVKNYAYKLYREQISKEYSEIDGVIDRLRKSIEDFGEVDLDRFLKKVDASAFGDFLFLYDSDSKKLHKVSIEESHTWKDGSITFHFADNDLDLYSEGTHYTTFDKENYGTCYILNVDRYDYGDYYEVKYPIYFSEEHYDTFKKYCELAKLNRILKNTLERKVKLEHELAKDRTITK